MGQFTLLPDESSIWFVFPSTATSGVIDLGFTGAYHAWVSALYPDATWLPSLNACGPGFNIRGLRTRPAA